MQCSYPTVCSVLLWKHGMEDHCAIAHPNHPRPESISTSQDERVALYCRSCHDHCCCCLSLAQLVQAVHLIPIYMHQRSSERCALALIAGNSDSFRRRNSGQNEASFSALHNVKSAQDEHNSALKAHFCSLTSPSFPLFQWQCLPRKRSSPHGLRGRRAA
jgi:hypothetical protein